MRRAAAMQFVTFLVSDSRVVSMLKTGDLSPAKSQSGAGSKSQSRSRSRSVSKERVGVGSETPGAITVRSATFNKIGDEDMGITIG